MSKIKDECKKEELNKILQEELLDAKLDYDQAFKMFNCAETDFVEIAIDNLHAAEIRLNSAIKRVKLLYKEIND